MIHSIGCAAFEHGDEYCNCKYKYREVNLRTMTAKKKSMTIPVFIRYFREKFLTRLSGLETNGEQEHPGLISARVQKIFDDCLREALLEELERRDSENSRKGE